MPFDSLEERVAFRRAAREVYDLASCQWAQAVMRAQEQWLDDLDDWHGGPPPPPPSGWPTEPERHSDG